MDSFSFAAFRSKKKLNKVGEDMAFNYNKNKNNDDSGSFWTSYSDLFLGMSVVFLLLYVTASLRQGTNGIQQQIQNQKLSMQVQDLKNQLKMYDSVKKDYLHNEAKPEEEKLYNELMDKLTLLKEEAKNEKDKLTQSALENDKKEKALNQYQQMVRNIVNANLMAKTKIKTRENVIDEQDEEIDTQDTEIANLEQDIAKKKKQIAANQEKIADANEQLQGRLADLKKAYRSKKMSEAAYERKVESVKEDGERKIAQLKSSSQAMRNQLADTQSKLTEVNTELDQTKTNLDQTKTNLAQTETENKNLQGKLSQAQEEYNSKVGELKRGFSDQAARDKSKFEGELAKERLSGAERARREAAFKAQAEQKAKDLGQKIASLGGELSAKENALKAKEGQLAQAAGDLANKEGQLRTKEGQLKQKEGQLKDTEGLLAKARAEADARKQIAKDIKGGFAKAGVQADINENTGEVIINFGDVYFDNDSAKLKEQMKSILNKAMPVYSKSLLGNKKVSDKISAVEIIGFASPTYKGRYVDPKGVDLDAKKAIDYNLDLSYNRARAIFQYVFDETKINYEHQKDMLPLIKVTGRSFLAETLPSKRNPSGNGDFCSNHDCKKAQRVIIRFSFEDKK